MISEDARMIDEAKCNYFRKAGKNLAVPGTNSETY